MTMATQASRRTVLAGVAAGIASNSMAAPDGGWASMLRDGNLVFVMRHAKSPREEPGPEIAQADNQTFERQLDAEGRATAGAMGRALAALKINVSSVLTSPTYRGRETARLLAVGPFKSVRELGDGGRGMDPVTEGERVEALRRIAETRPPAGTVVIAVTHLPNITGAFGEANGDMAEGESLILRPGPNGGAQPLGRIKIGEWPALAGL